MTNYGCSTRTRTSTWTRTPSKTPTRTGTLPSPTYTRTITGTSTKTATRTATHTRTSTWTATHTYTFTPTDTATPTDTPTPTITPSVPEGESWKFYYYAGSTRIAMRLKNVYGEQVYYFFNDHLGSTNVITDANGNVVTEMMYKAWGEIRYSNGSSPTDFTYTGQRSEMDDIGLMFYNARFYDPQLGRFIQADTIVPGAGNPGAYDRYSYVNNNPVRYDDPSGHCGPVCIFAIIMAVGAIGSAGVDIQSQLENTGTVDWEQTVESAMEGALIAGGAALGAVAVTVASPALVPGAVGVACADGDCTNEATAIGDAVNKVVSADGDPTNEIRSMVEPVSTTNTSIVPYYPPNFGFIDSAVPTTLNPGEQLVRYGSSLGKFLAPKNTMPWELSLPFGAPETPIYYEVIKPIENVYQGVVSPWFNQVGGGIQYYVGALGKNIDYLITNGFLKIVDK